MRRLVLVFLCWILVPPAPPVDAEMCTLDAVPAATLLVPYFEVDISPEPSGLDTIISINNAGSEPALAHVAFWTDWARAVINFDIFLTGFDVVTMSMFDVYFNGNLPITAHQINDPDDDISPQGDPTWDGNFPGCDDYLPLGTNPILTGIFINRMQNGNSGYEVAGAFGRCFGEELNGPGRCDNGICPPGTIARGFITIDSAAACSLGFPGEIDYFEDVANTQNSLWGDIFYLDGQGGAAFMPMVHIEADETFDASSTPTNYTFYGRFTQDEGGNDHREPLGTTWNIRYQSGVSTSTDWIVWRDPTADQSIISYPCGTGAGAGPDWSPLDQTQVLCFDQEENSSQTCAGDRCFPLATQKVKLDEGDLTVPFEAGHCRLNLNLPEDTILDDVDFPPDPPGNVAQSFVAAILSRDGLVTGGLPAIQLAHACQDLDENVQVLLFADGFETGDTSLWD